MKVILAVLMLLTLAGCNQNGLGAKSAVKNFFLTPVHAIKGVFTNASYKAKQNETLKHKERTKEGDIKYCLDASGSPIEQNSLNQLENLSNNLMTSACQCLPWGNCPIVVCPCEI